VTFAARGILVSLAFFAVVYCLLSSLVVLTWRGVQSACRKPSSSSANLLFGLRILPFVISLGVSVFFTFPSFWLLERRSLDEDTGTFVLGLCALLILGAGLVRLLLAEARTTRAVTRWRVSASSSERGAILPSIKAADGAPPLILVGIRKPNIMVSDMAAAVLSNDELRAAVRHELGHLRSWDNLKKVSISATPFPGMTRLERAWREAAELAADDSAVTNRREALDLASALIKLSRFSQHWAEPALASGLVTGSSSIGLRLERLIEWRMASQRLQRTWPWTILVLSTMITGIIGNYSIALVVTHRLTELLVP
jgi:beta-lactamase regulating signal transducer with metallopeptidase domain